MFKSGPGIGSSFRKVLHPRTDHQDRVVSVRPASLTTIIVGKLEVREEGFIARAGVNGKKDVPCADIAMDHPDTLQSRDDCTKMKSDVALNLHEVLLTIDNSQKCSGEVCCILVEPNGLTHSG